jgi:hypothetical protein
MAWGILKFPQPMMNGVKMKTRIVYPKLWFDEKFAAVSIEAKVLFLYLITSDQLSLTRYHHISDRQILFDTGLSLNQLKTSKEELTKLGWCFFTEGWVYHAHNAAYVDYTGRDRVLEAKDCELEQVPLKVQEIFNGLLTRYKPVLNHKSKTLNYKSETINGLEELRKKVNDNFRKKI